MKSPEQRVAEIRRPPTLANWVRLNAQSRDDTKLAIVKFAITKPTIDLSPIGKIIGDFVTMATTVLNVRKAINRLADARVAKLGREIIEVLLPWLGQENISGIRAFDSWSVPYPIGRGIIIPVKPTFTFNRSGKLTPVFLICWATMPFTGFQLQLLSTIIRRAILSQEGFEGSDALVLFVPRHKFSKSERWVRPMWVSKMGALTDRELLEQFDRFGNALDDAVPIILNELARRGER